MLVTENSSPLNEIQILTPRPKRRRLAIFLGAVLVGAAGTAFAMSVVMPPPEFTPRTIVVVEEGWSLPRIAAELEERHVVASADALRFAVKLKGGDRGIPSGAYLFDKPMNLFAVAAQLSSGTHGITTVKLTFPEGTTAAEMGVIAAEALPLAAADEFATLARPHEGYLFPDTYFFYETATSGVVIAALRENFDKKTAAFRVEAEASGRAWDDVITLASLVEEEAVTPEDRAIVSGILLARIDKGMALGVDATFAYTEGKGTRQITVSDLEDRDDPYNTYRHKGLPPGPITNPGLDAIDAALHPTTTAYLYYLSDEHGVLHFAKTFEEHKANKAKYIR